MNLYKNLLLSFLFFIFYTILQLPAFAEETEFHVLNSLDLKAEILEDSDKNISIDKLIQNPDFAFIKLTRPVFSAGYTESFYWIRLILPANPEKERILLLKKPIVSFAELYRIHEGKILQNEKAGLEIGSRSGQSLQYYFTIPPAGEEQTVYIRYRFSSALLIGPEIFLKENYSDFLINQHYLWGLFFGILLIMGIYNFFIFISTRDINYLYYCIVLFITGLYQFIIRGFTPFWITPDNIAATEINVIVFGISSTIATLIFLLNFIEMPKRQPVLAKIGMALILVFLMIIAAAFYHRHVWIYKTMIVMTELAIVYGFFSAIRAYWLGYKPAIFFIIATFFMLLGTMTYLLTLQGLMPFNWFTYNAQVYGSSLEVILFSFALGERIRINRKESAENVQRALELQKEMSDNLETQVTARTRELIQANATKDKFFSIIAHDLRGPIGSLSVLFNDFVNSPEDINEKELLKISQSISNTYDLLNNLLSWARNQRGELTFNPVNISLFELLNGSLATLKQSAIRKDIDLTLECPEEIYTYADQGMIASIIRNLVSNAIRFTQAGDKIKVSAMNENNSILVGVADTGSGIAYKKQKTIFQLDDKLHATLSEGGMTSGLGLVLCREFIEKHNGTIRVESVPGQGSTFWFNLPVGKQPDHVEQEIIDKLKRLKILVVEDNPLHQQTTCKVLDTLHTEYTIASNGELAIELSEKYRPDLILMDISLPKINGIEAAKKIRQNEHPPSWIIALTSYTQTELYSKWHDIKFDGFLGKPLEKAELLNLVSSLIQD